MSRVSASVSGHGSMVAAAPLQRRILRQVRGLPLGPDPVNLGMVHPEDRVAWGSRDRPHRPAEQT